MLYAFAFFSCAFQSTAVADQPPEITIQPKTNVFFAYGDTRFTDPRTCEFSDSDFRRQLIDGMVHTAQKPDFVIITGDVVYRGDNEDDWHVFDDETKELRNKKISLLPVLGNHDVRGTTGQSKFVDHFEALKPHPQLKAQGWYLVNYANTEFLMLDSQSSYTQDSPQGDWMRKKLKAVPEELAFLFIVLHHPLVTHASRLPSVYRCHDRYSRPALGHDVEDAEKHLKILLEEFSKTHRGIRIVVFSGHNHNYERYVENRITYVVTAGGGATPYRINRRSSDFYNEPGPTYHYCKFSLRGSSLIGEMYKLSLKGRTAQWERKDQFELSGPRAAE
ncbi:MAG: metallophosphoesterase [Acidobacteria bacterium]|nr:metallophosphoesterase [Acidobacteriota bacterium]